MQVFIVAWNVIFIKDVHFKGFKAKQFPLDVNKTAMTTDMQYYGWLYMITM